MRTKFLQLLYVGFLISVNSFSQSLAINNSGQASDNSAILDVSSSAKGVLVPRMTYSQKTSIISPAIGLLVFQTDSLKGFYYYDGLTWLRLGQRVAPICISSIPTPSYPTSNYGGNNLNSNTTAVVGQVFIPFQIMANQISFSCSFAIANPGKIKLALYSEDCLAKLFEVTSDTIFTGGFKTIALGSTKLIEPGLYYIVGLSLGTASINIDSYQSGILTNSFLKPLGKNVLVGTISVVPDTLPASFDPTTITFADSRCIQFRLDN